MYILSLFLFLQRDSITALTGEGRISEKTSPVLGIHRFYQVPLPIVPGSALPSSSQSLWPASQRLWL